MKLNKGDLFSLYYINSMWPRVFNTKYGKNVEKNVIFLLLGSRTGGSLRL